MNGCRGFSWAIDLDSWTERSNISVIFKRHFYKCLILSCSICLMLIAVLTRWISISLRKGRKGLLVHDIFKLLGCIWLSHGMLPRLPDLSHIDYFIWSVRIRDHYIRHTRNSVRNLEARIFIAATLTMQ